MSDSTLVMERQACFQIKTSFLPCTTLQITRYDLDQLAAQLEATVQKAPTFFVGSPLVVDLDGVKDSESIDFVSMKQILAQSNMVVIGVRGGTEQQRLSAAMVGMPSLALSKALGQTPSASAATTVDQPAPTKTATPAQAQTAKIITTPIRSGMQIYAKDADLIILSSVSVGAELLADGNIHVYGALRGRALAGVQGNTEARIFCRSLEAELVAIAGYYLVKEDIQHSPSHASMVQIYLDNEQVKIGAL